MLLAVALGGHPALAADPPATPAGQVDFAHKVVPLLRKQCGRCHTGARKQGGFSFNTRGSLLRGGESGPAVVEGKSAESLLLRRITSTDPDLQMPPEGPRLAAAEVETLRTWIDSGLTWDDGFAFEKSAYDPPLKPRRVELPPAVGDRTNPIDRLLDATAQRPAGQRRFCGVPLSTWWVSPPAPSSWPRRSPTAAPTCGPAGSISCSTTGSPTPITG
jgi:mono/diheme cytochrome c family protein